jgi:hypothetical protein
MAKWMTRAERAERVLKYVILSVATAACITMVVCYVAYLVL